MKKPPLLESQPFKVAEPLPLYVVYHRDAAFPGKFVVRRFAAGPDPEPLAVAGDLAEARAAITAAAPEAQRFGRGEHDDPAIREIWQ